MELNALKLEVLNYAMKMVYDHLCYGSQGNISARDIITGLIAITPTAIPYTEMAIEDICIVDQTGKEISGKWKPTSELALHLVFYQNEKDIMAVIHTHAPYSTVFAAAHKPIPMSIIEAATCIGHEVPIAPYCRPGTNELAQMTYSHMKGKSCALMANHGLISVGPNLARAYETTLAVESSARVCAIAESMGTPVVQIQEDEVKSIREDYLKNYHSRKVS
jgi:L-ribulose-5-phosphate 4-epimerase